MGFVLSSLWPKQAPPPVPRHCHRPHAVHVGRCPSHWLSACGGGAESRAADIDVPAGIVRTAATLGAALRAGFPPSAGGAVDHAKGWRACPGSDLAHAFFAARTAGQELFRVPALAQPLRHGRTLRILALGPSAAGAWMGLCHALRERIGTRSIRLDLLDADHAARRILPAFAAAISRDAGITLGYGFHRVDWRAPRPDFERELRRILLPLRALFDIVLVQDFPTGIGGRQSWSEAPLLATALDVLGDWLLPHGCLITLGTALNRQGGAAMAVRRMSREYARYQRKASGDAGGMPGAGWVTLEACVPFARRITTLRQRDPQTGALRIGTTEFAYGAFMRSAATPAECRVAASSLPNGTAA